MDALPPTGKHAHLPKDVLWRIKWSQPEVGAMLASGDPGIPMGQILDVAVCEVPGSLACPLAQGEGLTMALALDARVAEATRPT